MFVSFSSHLTQYDSSPTFSAVIDCCSISLYNTSSQQRKHISGDLLTFGFLYLCSTNTQRQDIYMQHFLDSQEFSLKKN